MQPDSRASDAFEHVCVECGRVVMSNEPPAPGSDFICGPHDRDAACVHDPAQFVTGDEGTSYCPTCEDQAVQGSPAISRARILDELLAMGHGGRALLAADIAGQGGTVDEMFVFDRDES